MQIKVREGGVFPLNRSQQVWWGDSPEMMQVARFAGHEMMAIADDAGAFDLD
uniref:hypothetical protein n=1 Tax=Pseudomonas fluorescens TaxID=294 RepID=UPI001F17EDEF|nr:hypothetical protein [Pseudomonas fluorescens]